MQEPGKTEPGWLPTTKDDIIIISKFVKEITKPKNEGACELWLSGWTQN